MRDSKHHATLAAISKWGCYLFSVTGNSRSGDCMEGVLSNTILGVNLLQEDGTSFDYSDYSMEATKCYRQDRWPRCSGTFPQMIADYGIISYFHDAESINVDLYVP